MTSRTPHGDALRISLAYAAFAALWILGTDLLVRIWIADLQQGMWIESLKGFAFAVVTGGLLYLWVRSRLKSREEELRNLRTLNEQVPDMIFRLRLRPRLEFEYVSPGAVNLAGFSPGEVYEDLDRVVEAVHPDDRPKLMSFLADPDSIDESVVLRWIHKEGHTVWVEFRVTRHLGESGHVDVVEGIARDITERRTEEERNALLATAVDAVGEAIYMHRGSDPVREPCFCRDHRQQRPGRGGGDPPDPQERPPGEGVLSRALGNDHRGADLPR